MEARSEQKEEELPWVRQIYHAALRGDKEKIQALIQEGASLEEVDSEWLIPPGAKLAQQGEEAAVDLLLEMGANLDNIAFGTAAGNHKIRAEYLRNRGASPSMLAKGAAFAGDRDYVLFLHDKYGADKDEIEFGAAWGHHLDLAEEIRNLHEDSRLKIACGAALGGDRETVNAYIQVSLFDRETVLKYAAAGGHTQMVLEIMGRIILGTGSIPAAEGAAWTEQRRLVDELKRRHNIDLEQELTPTFYGKLLGGHFQNMHLLQTLLDGDHNAGTIFEKIIQGGHLKTFDHLIKELHEKSRLASFLLNECFTKSLVKSGHLEYAIRIYNQYYFSNLTLLPFIAAGLDERYKDDHLLLHKLAFVKDKVFLQKLVTAADEGFILPENKSRARRFHQIAPKAIQIGEIMRKYDMDYEQALTYVEYRSLRKIALLVSVVNQQEKLPVEIMEIVFNYLSPELDEKRVRDVLLKVEAYKVKMLLNHDLTEYGKYTNLFAKHKSRAVSLAGEVQNARSVEKVLALLEQQHKIMKGETKPEKDPAKPKHEQPLENANRSDGYSELIEKHYNRLVV